MDFQIRKTMAEGGKQGSPLLLAGSAARNGVSHDCNFQ
jgi:hypothetical protein